MIEGLEYAIELLEKKVTRHKKMLSGDFSGTDEYMRLRHHNQMEALQDAVMLLRWKLRVRKKLAVPNNMKGGTGE